MVDRTAAALALALVACALLVQAAFAPSAAAQTPTAPWVARLAAFDPAKDSLATFLPEIIPPTAKYFLQLGTASLRKGGPLPEAFSGDLGQKLDASPGSLPLIVWQKEEGRLPGALIVARYRGVQPHQVCMRMHQRQYVVRHPLVDQYLGGEAHEGMADGWPAGAKLRAATATYFVDMPFGAGLFGLRPSYAHGGWTLVQMPNGVCLGSFVQVPMPAEEKARLRTAKDKDGDAIALDDDYYEAREYRLSSILLPELEGGVVRNAIHLYFVRIVPSLDAGTDLKSTGALASWLFSRGAEEAVIVPIKLIRKTVAQLAGK
ncbi:MAG: hypothetical protein EXR79_15830 [Myxococcales bacterium]|nr:hypothetical protein [Myxococcales bacterium]